VTGIVGLGVVAGPGWCHPRRLDAGFDWTAREDLGRGCFQVTGPRSAAQVGTGVGALFELEEPSLAVASRSFRPRKTIVYRCRETAATLKLPLSWSLRGEPGVRAQDGGGPDGG